MITVACQSFSQVVSRSAEVLLHATSTGSRVAVGTGGAVGAGVGCGMGVRVGAAAVRVSMAWTGFSFGPPKALEEAGKPRAASHRTKPVKDRKDCPLQYEATENQQQGAETYESRHSDTLSAVTPVRSVP